MVKDFLRCSVEGVLPSENTLISAGVRFGGVLPAMGHSAISRVFSLQRMIKLTIYLVGEIMAVMYGA